MILLLQIYGSLVAASFLVIGWMMLRQTLAAALYRLFSDPDPYPPEAAEADDLDTAVDWHRYEYEMRKQT